MKKIIAAVLVLAFLMVSVFVAFRSGTLDVSARASEQAQAATAPPASTPVRAGGQVVAEAKVVPIRSAALSMAANGIAAEVAVAEGSRVGAGDVLVRLSKPGRGPPWPRRRRRSPAPGRSRRAEGRLAGGGPGPGPRVAGRGPGPTGQGPGAGQGRGPGRRPGGAGCRPGGAEGPAGRRDRRRQDGRHRQLARPRTRCRPPRPSTTRSSRADGLGARPESVPAERHG